MSGHGSKHSGSPQSASQKAPPSKQQAPKRSRELKADFLLNFQRPPPHQRPAAYAPPVRRSGRPYGRQGRTPTAFVRGRFVQSSFRILVDAPSPDVLEASFSSDALIDWPHVRCVDLLCDEHPKCPICLEQGLVVPKITRCGHIFCLPCIMRYFLMLQGQNLQHSQRCPVCNEQVSPEDLTSVRFQMTRPLREEERFSFVLVHREASSISVRASASAAMEAQSPHDDFEIDGIEVDEGMAEAFHKLPCESEPGWHFSRVVRMLPGEHNISVAQEVEALRLYRPAAIRAGDTELLPSIDAAVALLEHQLPAGLLARVAEQPVPGSPPWGSRFVDVSTRAASSEGLEASASASEEVEFDGAAAGQDEGDDFGMDQPADSPSASASSSPSHRALRSPAIAAAVGPADVGSPSLAPLPASFPRSGPRIISFYQADDGRLVFLQPFFTKLLLHEHGGRWDQLPAFLPELRMERLHEVTMTEEVRKRYRFLAHLPLGSPAWFAEVDLRGHLSRETKELFAEDFAKRRQQRAKEKAKSRREERHSKHMAAVEEEKYWGSLNLRHPAVFTAPPTKEDFAVDLQGRTVEDVGEACADGEGGAEEDAGGAEEEVAGPTLADKIKGKIASKAKAKEIAPSAAFFPALGSGTAGASRSGNATSAWGVGKGSSLARNSTGSSSSAIDGQVEDGDSSQVAAGIEEEPTFGEALEAALSRASQQTPASNEAEPGAAGASAAGKKKKGKSSKATTIRLFG